MQQEINDFEEIRIEAENFYKNLKEVYCPYLKEKIFFNSNGLEHIKFKAYDKPRLDDSQRMRFKLLPLVPEILQKSHTLQGYRETKRFERVRKHNRTESVLQFVSYYEFIAMVKRNRIKIVIKQIESGPKFFWSVIPFWRMGSDKTRIFFEGSPEED
ncbi:MAG: hypothetical protein JWM92_237 [Candidatus Nomurabacteria bacterium]|jgi:hypothetical protein|nr:hypothetical protein [Candidatus Nomurabacteria bacterium]